MVGNWEFLQNIWHRGMSLLTSGCGCSSNPTHESWNFRKACCYYPAVSNRKTFTKYVDFIFIDEMTASGRSTNFIGKECDFNGYIQIDMKKPLVFSINRSAVYIDISCLRGS